MPFFLKELLPLFSIPCCFGKKNDCFATIMVKNLHEIAFFHNFRWEKSYLERRSGGKITNEFLHSNLCVTQEHNFVKRKTTKSPFLQWMVEKIKSSVSNHEITWLIIKSLIIKLISNHYHYHSTYLYLGSSKFSVNVSHRTLPVCVDFLCCRIR